MIVSKILNVVYIAIFFVSIVFTNWNTMYDLDYYKRV